MAKTVDDWLSDIDAGLEYRELFAREASWHKLEQDWNNDPEGDTAVGPNLIYAMGDSLTSSLMVPDPEFLVIAERQSGLDKAPIIESLDNYMIRKLKIKRSVDAGLLHSYLYSRTILKIGYDSEFGWSPYWDVGEGNNLTGMTFTQFDKKGNRIESPDTMPGFPWIRPVLPHDFAVPWGTIFLEDAPWAAHRVVRHIDSIRKDPKYKNAKGLQPMLSMEDFVYSYLTTGSKKQKARSKTAAIYNKKPEFVELWEIRDRMTNKVLVVSRNYDMFLRDDIDVIQTACGMPFVSGSITNHPRSFWTTPAAYYLGQIQKTQFDISIQAEKQRRISVLKFLYRKGVMSETAINRLMSSDVGAAEGIEATYPLGEIIAPVNTGSNVDFVLQAENSRRDAREAIGFSRNQLGEYDASSRRTAREATFVAQGSQLRTDRRAQMVVDLYTEAIDKVNKLIFNFWTMPREVLHDGQHAVVTGPMLKGDYQYDVSLTTKRHLSKAERKIEALSMMGQLATLPGIDPTALYQYLQDAAGDPAFERILSPVTQKAPAQGGQAAQGALPTIPATKTENA